MSNVSVRCDRRLLLAGLGAAVAVPLASSVAFAADMSKDEATLTGILEKMRVAITNGDAKTLNALLDDQVIYAHSDGHKVDTKKSFVDSLAGKVNYKTLVYSDVMVRMYGANIGVIRHTWDGADIMPDGSIGRSYIKVTQVWHKVGGKWKLFSRASCPIK